MNALTTVILLPTAAAAPPPCAQVGDSAPPGVVMFPLGRRSRSASCLTDQELAAALLTMKGVRRISPGGASEMGA